MEGVVAIFSIAYFSFIVGTFLFTCAVAVYFALWIFVGLFRIARWAAAYRSGK